MTARTSSPTPYLGTALTSQQPRAARNLLAVKPGLVIRDHHPEEPDLGAKKNAYRLLGFDVAD